MIRCKKTAAAALLATGSMMIGIAEASLVSQNDIVFGVDAITLDTSTGLEWLDLTKSKDLSFDFVSSQFAVGGQFSGFRYALNSEIATLWTNAGILNQTGAQDPANFAPIQTLQALIGITFYSSRARDDTTQGISGSLETSYHPWWPNYLPYLNGSAALIGENGWVSYDHNTGVGSWLVHSNVPVQQSSVPEPEEWALLMAGFPLMLFFAKRKKKPPKYC